MLRGKEIKSFDYRIYLKVYLISDSYIGCDNMKDLSIEV